MTTSLSSSDSSCSSYSMLTSQLDPLSEGQQFTAIRDRGGGIKQTYSVVKHQEHRHVWNWWSGKKKKKALKHWLVSGIRDSSVVWSLHFSTPTSLFRGNDFSGFFRPITDSAVNSFLSTLGWVYGSRLRFYFYGKAHVIATPKHFFNFIK